MSVLVNSAELDVIVRGFETADKELRGLIGGKVYVKLGIAVTPEAVGGKRCLNVVSLCKLIGDDTVIDITAEDSRIIYESRGVI